MSKFLVVFFSNHLFYEIVRRFNWCFTLRNEDVSCSHAILCILGDPATVSQAGRKVGEIKAFKHGQESPWAPTLTGQFPNGHANASS